MLAQMFHYKNPSLSAVALSEGGFLMAGLRSAGW